MKRILLILLFILLSVQVNCDDSIKSQGFKTITRVYDCLPSGQQPIDFFYNEYNNRLIMIGIQSNNLSNNQLSYLRGDSVISIQATLRYVNDQNKLIRYYMIDTRPIKTTQSQLRWREVINDTINRLIIIPYAHISN